MNRRSRVSLSNPFYTDFFNFLANGLNIFTQDFATQLPYVAFRLSWQTLQTSLQLFLFWAGLFSLFPSSKDLQIISFSHARNKSKKYENPLAPTVFAIK